MTAAPLVILTPAERVASPLRQPITWRTPSERKRMTEAFAEFEKIYRKHQAAGWRGDGSAGRS